MRMETIMSPQKEKCLEMIDAYIDRGVDVFKLRRELPSIEYERFRACAKRSFGGVREAFREYGLYDATGIPSDSEIAKCFWMTEKFQIVRRDEEVERLTDIYALDDVTFRRISRETVNSLEVDALDEFYRAHFPFDEYPTKRLREDLPKLYGYMRKHYGTYKRFRKAYKVPEELVDRDYGGKDSIHFGHEFERKLGDILRALYPDVKYHEKIGNCFPDYVVGSTWVDAKLSAGTIRDPRSQTLDKYSKETESLVIYYARDEEPPFSYGKATVKHVSTLYPALYEAGCADLVADMDAFISSVSYGKETVGCREVSA